MIGHTSVKQLSWKMQVVCISASLNRRGNVIGCWQFSRRVGWETGLYFSLNDFVWLLVFYLQFFCIIRLAISWLNNWVGKVSSLPLCSKDKMWLISTVFKKIQLSNRAKFSLIAWGIVDFLIFSCVLWLAISQWNSETSDCKERIAYVSLFEKRRRCGWFWQFSRRIGWLYLIVDYSCFVFAVLWDQPYLSQTIEMENCELFVYLPLCSEEEMSLLLVQWVFVLFECFWLLFDFLSFIFALSWDLQYLGQTF